MPGECQAPGPAEPSARAGAGGWVGERGRGALERVRRRVEASAPRSHAGKRRRGEQRSGAARCHLPGRPDRRRHHATQPSSSGCATSTAASAEAARDRRLGGSNPASHGLAGQRVPEPEHVTIHGQQLATQRRRSKGSGTRTPELQIPDGGPQQLASRNAGRAPQLPQEQAAQSSAKPDQPRPNHVGGKRLRHARRGEHLLHQERHTVGCALHPGQPADHPQSTVASPNHQRNLSRRPGGPTIRARRRAPVPPAGAGKLNMHADWRLAPGSWPRTRRARPPSCRRGTPPRPRVSGSAQCRSSRAISSPPGTPRRRIRRITASPPAN